MRYDERTMVAATPFAVAADLLALPEERRAEIVGGVIVEKAAPTFDHGDAQAALVGYVRPIFHRRGHDGSPGGWWIASEVDIQMETHELYRPDIVGWRRERWPERPTGRPVLSRPDWVCVEVLSKSNASTDLVDKFRVYERCGVPHYWIVDTDHAVLTVYRWASGQYVVALQAKAGETVRAEPFDAIELKVGTLFGEDVD